MRHPPVDQHHRHTARRAGQDQVRPQIGFDEQRQRRLPVIEEAGDITRRVVRHILMDNVGRKTFGHDRRRRHRARGQKDAQIERAQPLDQRGRRQHLADAGAVDPHQGTMGPRIERQPAPLADALGILLALLEATADHRGRQRNHRERQFPVDPQRHRQRISQGRPPGGPPAHRRGGSLR